MKKNKAGAPGIPSLSPVRLPSRSPDCWACGRPMQATMMLRAYWCPGCEVATELDPFWFSRVDAITAQTWIGGLVTYVDHSRVHLPSPA
jgi:hypothetical protein